MPSARGLAAALHHGGGRHLHQELQPRRRPGAAPGIRGDQGDGGPIGHELIEHPEKAKEPAGNRESEEMGCDQES